MMDRKLNLRANGKAGFYKHIQSMVDDAFRRILYGHNTIIRMFTFHFRENIRNTSARNKLGALAEPFQRRLMCEGPFGAKKSNTKFFLKTAASMHDFVEHLTHGVIR